jgi:NDP-sugar pyrophosphorylase family protein
MKPTLLVLAAGMGSRYAGLKQIEGFGPSGETIMDYSVHDALAAGFGKLVFVIRRDFEAAFREAVGRKHERRVAVDYVFQQLDEIPPGSELPPGRTKPWGTAHAIWCARNAIAEPFASINADDYYGKQAFRLVAEHLGRPQGDGTPIYAMVGYPIVETLSDHAAVTRALCEVDGQGFLAALVERMKVERKSGGARYHDEAGDTQPLRGDEVVSMNFWGFTPEVFGQIERHLGRFLEAQLRAPSNGECLIPVVVGELLRERAARVLVFPTPDRWFGVTHPEDKPGVMQMIREMVARGDYPSPLWPGEAGG